MSKLAHSNDETMHVIDDRHARIAGEWIMAEVDRIGTELDNTPHRNNADYVDHFERLLSAALHTAYFRGRLGSPRFGALSDDIERLQAALAKAETLARTYPDGELWSADGNFPFVAHGLIGKGQDCAALDIATAIQALTDGQSPGEKK